MARATKTMIAEFTSKSNPSIVHKVVRNDETGEISCGCRGWIYKRPNQPRGCRHTKTIAAVNNAY